MRPPSAPTSGRIRGTVALAITMCAPLAFVLYGTPAQATPQLLLCFGTTTVTYDPHWSTRPVLHSRILSDVLSGWSLFVAWLLR